MILDLSFHNEVDGILGLARGHGDVRDGQLLDALGTGTWGAGVAGVRTTVL